MSIYRTLIVTLAGFVSSISAASNSFGVTRPTFLLGYQEVRCFKETFYHGGTLDLYIELEQDQIKESMIKDPAHDGIRFHIVSPASNNYAIIHKQVLSRDQVYFSYTYDIVQGRDYEGSYRVCLGASDSLYENAAAAAQAGE